MKIPLPSFRPTGELSGSPLIPLSNPSSCTFITNSSVQESKLDIIFIIFIILLMGFSILFIFLLKFLGVLF